MGRILPPRDLSVVFANPEYTAWTSFREADESRFVALAVPRCGPVAVRRQESRSTGSAPEFAAGGPDSDEPVPPGQCVWMNPAYAMAVRMTDAFSKYGFCTAIRGAGGGRQGRGAAGVHLQERRRRRPEKVDRDRHHRLDGGRAGPPRVLGLYHARNADHAVFISGQTTHKPKSYDRPEATNNAVIAARLPFQMAVSRIAHP